MTTQVNIYDAKTHLSDLVERAAGGEDIVIAKAGHPRVRLVPIVDRTSPRRLGTLQGSITIESDFDQPLEDLFGLS